MLARAMLTDPRDIYWGLAMIPLFIFGHHTRAIEVGTQLLITRHRLWSTRVAYVIHFYLAASLLTLHNDYPAQGISMERWIHFGIQSRD